MNYLKSIKMSKEIQEALVSEVKAKRRKLDRQMNREKKKCQVVKIPVSVNNYKHQFTAIKCNLILFSKQH